MNESREESSGSNVSWQSSASAKYTEHPDIWVAVPVDKGTGSTRQAGTCVQEGRAHGVGFLLLQELEANASAQLRETSGENQSLKKELVRLEDRNNQLQGYGLDDMSAEELSNLIHALTQVYPAAATNPLWR